MYSSFYFAAAFYQSLIEADAISLSTSDTHTEVIIWKQRLFENSHIKRLKIDDYSAIIFRINLFCFSSL